MYSLIRVLQIDILSNVTCSQTSHSKPCRSKSMLTHQGWFTALYTQHLLDSQSLEFEICIFPREGGYPVTLLPPPRRLAPSLGLGTTWVRHYPGLAVVIIPPLPPNVKCSRAKPQQTPSVEKHAHPPRVVYCAIYPTRTRFTKSLV